MWREQLTSNIPERKCFDQVLFNCPLYLSFISGSSTLLGAFHSQQILDTFGKVILFSRKIHQKSVQILCSEKPHVLFEEVKCPWFPVHTGCSKNMCTIWVATLKLPEPSFPTINCDFELAIKLEVEVSSIHKSEKTRKLNSWLSGGFWGQMEATVPFTMKTHLWHPLSGKKSTPYPDPNALFLSGSFRMWQNI